MLRDWRQRKLLGCIAASNVTSRPRFMVLCILQWFALSFWQGAIIISVSSSPWRALIYYLAVLCICLVKVGGTAFGALDFLLNVVEYRAVGRVFFRQLLGT